ncbi:MAG TPA: hypothetical protein ENK85_01845 [Saprospiraceae bacterium]|nr:hypothetical protein [Saprospiraceae bacterium]
MTQVKQINTYVKQIEAANDAINSIVCGDFNDTPTAPSISYLLSSQDLTYFDSYHVVHPNASGFTIPSNNPNAKIDYVFYTHQNELIPASSETVMDGMIVNNLYRSDHLGVMTQFVFSPNATTELESREFKILDGFTNPYLSNSPIEFELYSPSQVNVNLYNSAGQKLKLLLSKRMGAGRHQVSFDATHLAGQFLFVKIEISGRVETVRLVTLP